MVATRRSPGLAGPQVTAQEATRLLGIVDWRTVHAVLKKAGVSPSGSRMMASGHPGKLYPRAAVERVAESLATGELRDEIEERKWLDATRDECECGTTLGYGEDDRVLPDVLYGLLTYRDARELERRKARNPDWRPRRVA